MAEGIQRMLKSGYWINTVFPAFKSKYPIAANKIEKAQAGEKRPLPTSDFALGIVEEIRKHPLAPPPSTNFGLWEKPVTFLHNARGGVEYWDQQKALGSVTLDLNNPGNVPGYDPSISTPWEEKYIPIANQKGLPWTYWKHCHNYSEIQAFLDKIKDTPQKTGCLNLESVGSEGLSIPRIADMIDSTLGTQAILAIPTLGWMDGIDWSALRRHVFQLEFFLNDIPTYPDGSSDWAGIPDVTLAKQLAQHAREHCGVNKLTFLCGMYDSSSYNPNARTVTPAQYKSIIAAAGERFGGIYLGDSIGSNYAPWLV